MNVGFHTGHPHLRSVCFW